VTARAIALVCCLWLTGVAVAAPGETDPLAVADDPTFGPVVTIERIDLLGNDRTSDDLVRRTLRIHVGDRLRTGDPRFAASRFALLSLGHFVDVDLRLDRGSSRGLVVVTVQLAERGTFVLNRIFLGTSDATPIWAGFDVGDTNLLGTGFDVGVGFVWAAEGRVPEADQQVGVRVRVGTPRWVDSRLGVRGTFLHTRGSLPVRNADAAPDADDPQAFTATRMLRTGGTLGGSWDLSSLSALLFDLRFEQLGGDADARLFTLSLGYQRDTRPDPVLPYAGSRVMLVVEGGKDGAISELDQLGIRAAAEHWWPIGTGRHALALAGAGGILFGDPPPFDRFFPGDLNPLMTPRPLDLVVSTAAPFDVFDTGADERPSGNVFLAGRVEYAYRILENSSRLLYGGQLFVTVGALGLGEHDGDRAGLGVDLTANLGIRLDTQIGLFELSLGNGLGRLPL
jgi:outer membrane protein insertion porin family